MRKLQGYDLQVDIYGKCDTPLEEDAIHMINSTYKFYLSLENANCKDYVTEKFFNYFALDTIVIARGGADYGRLLPNDSFIDTSHFRTIKQLVDFLILVNSSETLYLNLTMTMTMTKFIRTLGHRPIIHNIYTKFIYQVQNIQTLIRKDTKLHIIP